MIINQIEFCDVLLFNKTDLLTNEQQLYLKSLSDNCNHRLNF
ncbi:GTP-binding protein [Lentilactobacillus hilgardii]|nr:hypothetical protein [Lentilactobacillus hilgardii]QEU38000.1 GTP-binding protein [Lentilactobacillus hilgardii]